MRVAFTLGGAFAALAGTVGADQPGAARPVPGPMRDLVWGKLNFLHTTDTHGWHAGHLQEPQYSADWGDYISFANHMRARADREGVDLLLVDTGDRVEGNGLYDASKPKGKYYYHIYREQHVDLISSGNHELYVAATAAREHDISVPNFREHYIASNLDYIDPKTGERVPMAPQRYRRFRTKNQKLEIVAFGFIFDFFGNANNTVVQPVRETVQEPWFQEAIRDEPDVFVVYGHIGVRMPEFRTIFTAIREKHPLTPILFFGGHVHVRDATAYDSRSFAVASGRYFETIGWMSVSGDLRRDSRSESSSSFSFHRRYIDNNLFGYYHHTGLNASTFPTEHGRDVSAMIARARKELDLDRAYGCAPKTLWMFRTPYPGKDNIYSWIEEEVLPDVVINPSRGHVPRLVLINTGAIRFDIIKGPFTIDTTYIVSPFTSSFTHIPDVPYSIAKKVLDLLNSGGKILEHEQGVPENRWMASPEQFFVNQSVIYEKASVDDAPVPAYGVEENKQRPIVHDDSREDLHPRLTEGYTTVDDIGTDGDDTIHAPMNTYVVPNAIQAKVDFPEDGNDPETVDLVFLDFIAPWVLVALKLLGGNYEKEDISPYVEGTFTQLMAGWIEKNWPKQC
ncbi:hypothetical protein VTJ04DRAFT_2625 [Mycothermus thermophilus]|uniref:uncharacterized protein n=1 Tax=Humicola insolens TaxID=85995 RepID=UPI003742FA36